jgi:hypothetical protein
VHPKALRLRSARPVDCLQDNASDAPASPADAKPVDHGIRTPGRTSDTLGCQDNRRCSNDGIGLEAPPTAQEHRMKTYLGIVWGLLALTSSWPVMADMQLVAPDGRSVLLKDNGSWSYVDGKTASGVEAKDAKAEQAMLALESKTPFGPNCRVALTMTNRLPYEIVQIVPYFSAMRANGVMHQSLGLGFQNVRPTDSKTRVVEFTGIACNDIARIQVVGGDRCEMGELTKFSADKGQCLARVRVMPSDVLTFEK